MKICVANFPGTVTDADLSALFVSHGPVESAEVATDAFTGVSRGFGYVTMSDETAEAAIRALNGTEWQGLTLAVTAAPPSPDMKGSYRVGAGPVVAYRFRKN